MILRYILKMLPFMLAALPVYVLLRLLYRKRRKMKEINYRHECALLVFVVFIVGLGSLTVFPQPLATVSNSMQTVNLQLFKVLRNSYITIIEERNPFGLVNLLGNIVMFMPFGFFPALLWKSFSLKKAILLGTACSIFIELCQLFLPRGTDVDDIWLNALGAAAGYLVYKLLAKLFPDKLQLYR